MTDPNEGTRGAGDQLAGAAARSRDDRQACPTCPWRMSNRGRNHPDGWFDPENLARLWQGVRDGEPMGCHPTQADNPVSEAAQAAGYRPAPAGSKTLECVGSLIAAQRELQIMHDEYGGDWPAYHRARPNGLTKLGVAEVAARLLLGNTPLAMAMPRPNLNHPDVEGVPGLDWPDRYRKDGDDAD